MTEYGFSLTLIFPFKDRIEDSVLIRKIQVTENSYSGKFYVVEVQRKLWENTAKPVQKIMGLVFFQTKQ